jgi:hypothetical protein
MTCDEPRTLGSVRSTELSLVGPMRATGAWRFDSAHPPTTTHYL